MKLSLRALPLLASVAFSALAGCNFHLGDSTTGGDTGNATFAYESGDGCFFGCAMGPMMAGTTESVNADLSSTVAGATVVADDPSVLTVSDVSTTCCTTSGNSSTCGTSSSQQCNPGDRQSLSFHVTAHAPGSTKVRVMHGASEIDGIVLSVETPAAISPYCSDDHGSSVSLVQGATCTLGWAVRNAQGSALQASQGVSLQVLDPTVAGFVELGGPPASSVSDGQLGLLFGSPELQAVAPGQTQVVATAGDASGQLAVSVTAK